MLALLGLLTLIGFFALSFTSQENQSATYFANGPTAKVLAPSLPADPFFDDILRQIIIGPSAGETQSACGRERTRFCRRCTAATSPC